MVLYKSMGKSEKTYNYRRILMFIIAWGILPLGYLAWCFTTISYVADYYLYLACITWIAALSLYVYISQTFVGQYDNLKTEIKLLDISLICLCLMLCTYVHKEFEKRFWIFIYLTLVISLVILINNWIKNRKLLIRAVGIQFKSHKCLLGLLGITFILCLDNDMYQFKWDGLLYYLAASRATLRSISSVSLYGHMAQTSGVLYRIGALICNNTGYGMALANIVVLLIGTCAFYGSVKILLPNMNEIKYIIFTACFAFSPFTLGMVNYYSTDYFCVCLISVLIYFVLKEKWVLSIPVACIFVFTKEPALIAYAGLCLGLVIKDIITADGKLKDRLLFVIGKVHYYFLLIPVFIWYITYRILGQWSAGEGGIGFDIQYIMDKLKVFLVLNFNWVATLGIMASVIVLLIRKENDEIIKLFPLIFSNGALLLFNCVYITVNHARYIDSFFCINMLLAIVMICKASMNENNRSAIMFGSICIAVLLLISSFITIDPISKMIFRHENVGKASILSTGTVMLGDASIYNKQMLWMERPLLRAISDSYYEGDTIILALPGKSVYAFDGMSEEINYDERLEPDLQYWNDEKHCRISYADEGRDNSLIKQLEIYHLPQNTTIDKLKQEDKDSYHSVIYIKGLNDYKQNLDYEIIESQTYNYRGWSITRDRLKRKWDK